jgi:hypothetical protein
MSFHRCATFVVVFVASACASSSSRDPFGQDFETTTAARANRGNSTLITRAELAEYRGDSVYRAVEQIRRRWLTARRGGLIARVVIDGSYRTDLSQLRSMGTEAVEELRLLSPGEATTKYGTGFPGGAIDVIMRGR